MVTNVNNIYKIKEKNNGYLSKSGLACKAGEKYPIYIPSLMPKISSGTPTVSAVLSKGVLCFKNAPSCKVLTATMLKSQNYLSIPFERNKSWKGQAEEKPDGSLFVKKNTKVICNCVSNSISDMTFSND